MKLNQIDEIKKCKEKIKQKDLKYEKRKKMIFSIMKQ